MPCNGDVTPLSDEEEDGFVKEVPFCHLNRDEIHRIRKQFIFPDFQKAMIFVKHVADLAESEGHQLNIFVSYNKVDLEIYTHAVGGLTENDFISATRIDPI